LTNLAYHNDAFKGQRKMWKYFLLQFYRKFYWWKSWKFKVMPKTRVTCLLWLTAYVCMWRL